MKCTRIYADEAGDSHYQDYEIELSPTDFAPPAPPTNVSTFFPATQYGFISVPPNWKGDWHATPHRQIMFFMAGEVEVRVSSGEVRTFRKGDILLLEDTKGKGHIGLVKSKNGLLQAVVQLPG